MKSLDKNELIRLLEAAKINKVHYLAILIAYSHGLRASEVTQMRGSQVKDGYLTVERLKGSLKTVQPILIEREAIEKLAVSVGLTGRLFPFSTRWFQKLMHRYGKLAGIPYHKARCHTLKHTCAMLALEGGMKLNEVQAYLGHKSLSSTGQYLKVNDDQASKAFAKAVGL
jgi:integrase/recombinase XerD